MSDRPAELRRGATTGVEPKPSPGGGVGSATPPFGTERDDPPTCAVCGKAIRQDEIVCPHCGTPLVAG